MSSHPRRSLRLATKMPVVQDPSHSSKSSELIQQTQPRRSPRLAAKRVATQSARSIAEHTNIALLPFIQEFNRSSNCTEQMAAIHKIMSYLSNNPDVLIWIPSIRITISNAIRRILGQINSISNIDTNDKNKLTQCFESLQQTLITIQSHPEYVP